MKFTAHSFARSLFFGMCVLLVQVRLQAERIYILPGVGYNQCDPELVAAIQANGHTVVVDLPLATILPIGFTSTCVDPVNGWDWLCLFGEQDRSSLAPDVQAFTSVGGKVFLQWEVDCCEPSADGSAVIASLLTGNTITPNIELHISLSSPPPGWVASSVTGCAPVIGNAYRCMDGLPAGTGMEVTGDLNQAAPPFTTCPYFGFRFFGTSMADGNGGLVGFGDVNVWYLSGDEPPNSGGSQPVDTALVDMVFPAGEGVCSLLPPGCLLSTGSPEGHLDAGNDLFELAGGSLCDGSIGLVIGTGRSVVIELFDNTGRSVKAGISLGPGPVEFSTTGITAGSYVLRAQGKGRVQVERVLIH